MLVFVIFVAELVVTKFPPTKINATRTAPYDMNSKSHNVGVVTSGLVGQLAERSLSYDVSTMGKDVSLSLLSTS